MKGFLSLITLAALPLAMAFNPHDAGVSRRHHHLERAVHEVALPAETDGIELAGNATHELGRRAFTNARASWYKVGMGACGLRNGPSDFIVALNAAQFGGGYPGKNCFKKIRITYRGISAIAEIRDRCPGCPYGGLDFSEGLFRHFSGLGTGIIYMQWEFTDGSGGGSSTTSTTRSTRRPTPTPTPTSTRTSTTRHSSSSSTTRSSSTRTRTSTSDHDDDEEETSTTTETPTSTTETPTPTVETPTNRENLLQAVLQMAHMLSAGSRDARGD